MLDAYIIDSIRQAELERERDAGRRIELELPLFPPRAPETEVDVDPAADRGVIVIPLHSDDRPEDDAA